MKYNGSNFDEVIEEHKLWLNSGFSAKYGRADFQWAGLEGKSLKGLDLRYAHFYGAYLVKADLSGADLRDADMFEAHMRAANLTGANLENASFYRTDLTAANLSGANLCCAQFYRTRLVCADLTGAKIDVHTQFVDSIMDEVRGAPNIPIGCPDTGEFIAWTPCRIDAGVDTENRFAIVKLKIPEDARRSSDTDKFCTADKVIVLEIQSLDGKPLDHVKGFPNFYNFYKPFTYEAGKTLTPKFSHRFSQEAWGIHFFINRRDAVGYAH